MGREEVSAAPSSFAVAAAVSTTDVVMVVLQERRRRRRRPPRCGRRSGDRALFDVYFGAQVRLRNTSCSTLYARVTLAAARCTPAEHDLSTCSTR